VNAECYPRYQTSDVRVYTKFYTVHDRRDVYMRGGKVEVFADVTRYVQHLIQSSNKDVVRYENGLIVGVTPGKATIKVRNHFYQHFFNETVIIVVILILIYKLYFYKL